LIEAQETLADLRTAREIVESRLRSKSGYFGSEPSERQAAVNSAESRVESAFSLRSRSPRADFSPAMGVHLPPVEHAQPME
jgi:hypothetical protein